MRVKNAQLVFVWFVDIRFELLSKLVSRKTWIAINYTLSQWGLLIGYCEDGRLNISNALAENAIRPFAVGRRNWLCVTRRRTHETEVKLAA